MSPLLFSLRKVQMNEYDNTFLLLQYISVQMNEWMHEWSNSIHDNEWNNGRRIFARFQQKQQQIECIK